MNLISFFQTESWYDIIATFSVISSTMQSTRSLPELIAMGLIGLAVLIAVLGIIYKLLNHDEAFEIRLSERPLPNIFLGWILLWLMSALLLTIYPFPTRATMNPQRSTPPYIVAEPKSSEPSEEAAPVTQEDAPAAELLVNNGCGGCHTIQGVEGMAGVVGPDLSQIGANAAQRLEDPAYTGSATTPEEYIHESIVQSDLFVVADYPAGVMPLTFGDTLSPEDLDAMINFLASRQ